MSPLAPRWNSIQVIILWDVCYIIRALVILDLPLSAFCTRQQLLRDHRLKLSRCIWIIAFGLWGVANLTIVIFPLAVWKGIVGKTGRLLLVVVPIVVLIVVVLIVLAGDLRLLAYDIERSNSARLHRS